MPEPTPPDRAAQELADAGNPTIESILGHASDCPRNAPNQGMCSCWPQRDRLLAAWVQQRATPPATASAAAIEAVREQRRAYELFTPLTDAEVKRGVNAIVETLGEWGSDRLHAQWARVVLTNTEKYLTQAAIPALLPVAWDELEQVIRAYVSPKAPPGGDSPQEVVLAAVDRIRKAVER